MRNTCHRPSASSRKRTAKGRYSHLIALVVSLALQSQAAQTQADSFQVLHNFASGTTANGWSTYNSLVREGAVMYGMTGGGGENNRGIIYSIGTDGSGFEILHDFDASASDGGNPSHNTLIVDGSILYGMTPRGGLLDDGVIFSINTNGSDFTLLHSFGTEGASGLSLRGSLLQSGSTLYGMTKYGGASNYGTVFRIDTDGTDFQILHSFASTTTNGRLPDGSLIQHGSTLYGMTPYGGTNDEGVIFSVGTDGNGFQLLHSFDTTATNGANPFGSLIHDGSHLYGMSDDGGISDKGTIFKIEMDGSDFQLLHSFDNTATNGGDPEDSLTLIGSTLYGMARTGGMNDDGVIFRIEADGSDFQLLHSFDRTTDGGSPYGSLIYDGSAVYGTTLWGGTDGHGIIFSLAVPEPSASILLLIASLGGWLVWRRRR